MESDGNIWKRIPTAENLFGQSDLKIGFDGLWTFLWCLSDINFMLGYDKVSANTASSESWYYENLTGLRIHVEGPQIYQMIRQTYSFQNMCDML